tara:strand:+ start:3047 stop:3445 length:399 start_codon:yes stop_codon:yes gene_type:complete
MNSEKQAEEKIEHPKLILIRGLPGSGKSTLAKTLFPEHILIEADQFFMRSGAYQFDFDKIKEAHAYCQKRTLKAFKSGLNVVVANAFIEKWEMEPYLSMNYPTQIIIASGNFQNTHNVSDEDIVLMREMFEI